MITTFKKQLRYKLDRLKRVISAPKHQYKAFKKLYRIMGFKGVFWHMAHQGRWPFWLGFLLSFFSLGGLYFAIHVLVHPNTAILTKAFVLPFIALSFFCHYVLWRITALRRPHFITYGIRLYVGIIMLLAGLLVVFVFLKTLQSIISFFLA